MSQKPAISVVIAVYNGAKHLEEQMDALLAQRCDFPWEALYVDNGSRDSSREIISRRIERDKLTHVRLVDGSQHPGQVHARNYGSSQARADLFAYTDQDDLPAPDWLARMIVALSQADAVGGAIIRTSEGYPPPADRDTQEAGPRFMLYWSGYPCAAGTNFGIHRHVFDAIGGWRDLDVHAGEDVDISIRLKLAGFSLAYGRDVRVTWRARIGLRNILEQAVTYGRADVLLFIRFREHGVKRRDLRGMLRVIKQTITAQAGLFHTPRSYWGLHKLGFLCGRIYESVRSRTLWI